MNKTQDDKTNNMAPAPVTCYPMHFIVLHFQPKNIHFYMVLVR